jgi:hypothetical protein
MIGSRHRRELRVGIIAFQFVRGKEGRFRGSGRDLPMGVWEILLFLFLLFRANNRARWSCY